MSSQHKDLASLFPELSGKEFGDAEQTLTGYLEVILRIHARLEHESSPLTAPESGRTLEDGRTITSQSPQSI